MPRTHVVDHDKLLTLIAERAWTLEEFMAKSGLSHGPFDRIREGKGIFFDNLRTIAETLGVEPVVLKPGYQPPEGKRKLLRVKIKEQLTGDELRARLEEIERAAGSKFEIEVEYEMTGSTIVGLNMDERDAEALLAAFAEGKLQELGVVEVTDASGDAVADEHGGEDSDGPVEILRFPSAAQDLPAASRSGQSVLDLERIRRAVEGLVNDQTVRASLEELLRYGMSAVPSLLEALERRDAVLRRRAFEVLKAITRAEGQFDFDSDAPHETRSRQVEQLRARLRRG